MALRDYSTRKLETRQLKTGKNGQKLSTNIINRDLPETEVLNPAESISKLGMLLGKVNQSKMKLFNTKNVEDNKDTIDTVFNVQHDKLNLKFIKSQSCCLFRKTPNIKISARLKREAGDLHTCACLSLDSVYRTDIKNILGGSWHGRLKIYVRI
jgi:hypothetical protein